jgi:hypothetical protein
MDSHTQELVKSTLDDVVEDVTDGDEVLKVMGLTHTVDELETYLRDLIEEEGALPEGEFDDFEMCGDCDSLTVFAPGTGGMGYRHIRTGLPDCDE